MEGSCTFSDRTGDITCARIIIETNSFSFECKVYVNETRLAVEAFLVLSRKPASFNAIKVEFSMKNRGICEVRMESDTRLTPTSCGFR